MKKIQLLLHYALLSSMISYSQSNSFELNILDSKCIKPKADIKAWWSFDDTTKTAVIDIFGSNDGLIINEAKYTLGKVGNALHFVHGNSYVGIPDNDLWTLGKKDFTIEFWVNFDSLVGGSIGHPGAVFISHDEGSGSRSKWFFALGGGFLYFHVNGSNNNGFFAQAPFVPSIGQWYHLAVTRDRNQFIIYINGIPSSTENRDVYIPDVNAPLVLGQSNEPFGGFMYGYLDEVSFYQQALNQEDIITIYNAENNGKCKNLKIVSDSVLYAQLHDSLHFNFKSILGMSPCIWSVIDGGLPYGLFFSSDGTLSGIPMEAAEYNVKVRVTDTNNDYADQLFNLTVLISLPPANIKIIKNGTVAVPGREMDYFILVENAGRIIAKDLEVVEFLDLRYFSLLKTDPQAIDSLTSSEISFVVWNIPELLAGESIILSYKVLLNPSTPIGINVSGSVCAGIELGDRLAECLLKLSLASTECAICVSKCSTISGCGTILACLPAISWCSQCIFGLGPKGPAGCGPDAIRMYNCFKSLVEDCYSDDNPTMIPTDPNEMVVMPGKYIRSDQRLIYITHFENIGQVEARDVFVNVVLDDPNLDLSTIEILSSDGGSFNKDTKTINWKLLGRNLLPGETDNVMISIKPLPDLPSGTELHNKADIQFEIFDVNTTNEVVNIIDNVKPVGVMNSLPEILTSPEFTISWTGKDSVGEISDYSIFVSVDSGGFISLIEETYVDSSLFIGEFGKTYTFICIAKDKAGNIEIQKPIGETTTTVTHEATAISQINNSKKELEILNIYPNPSINNTTITFEILNSTFVSIVIYDLCGREIKRIAEGKYDEGKHFITWDGKDNKNRPMNSGLYLIRMQVGSLTAVKKVILIS